MQKAYVVERNARPTTKPGLVFRDSHSGQFSPVKIMSKDTFDRASARANTAIKTAREGTADNGGSK